MENGGGVDHLSINSSADDAASTARLPSPDSLEDTITVDDTAAPGHDDCPSDNEMEDLPAPSFTDTKMIEAEKLGATKM